MLFSQPGLDAFAPSDASSNIHFHITSRSEPYIFNVDGIQDYDLVLVKKLEQRIVGFPWLSFVERKGDAVLASPL